MELSNDNAEDQPKHFEFFETYIKRGKRPNFLHIFLKSNRELNGFFLRKMPGLCWIPKVPKEKPFTPRNR